MVSELKKQENFGRALANFNRTWANFNRALSNFSPTPYLHTGGVKISLFSKVFYSVSGVFGGISGVFEGFVLTQ